MKMLIVKILYLTVAAALGVALGLFILSRDSAQPSLSVHTHVVSAAPLGMGYDGPVGEDVWTYDDVKLYWGQMPKIFTSGQTFGERDGWSCFRMGATTLDPVFGGYILSHGTEHAICFQNLARDGWKGPTTLPRFDAPPTGDIDTD